MVISQGEVWWADLPAPAGSGLGFRRPVVVVQSDVLNRSRIATLVCVPLTSNLKWALAPGNVQISACLTGLPKASVANVPLTVSVDKDLLTARMGSSSPSPGRLSARISEIGLWPTSANSSLVECTRWEARVTGKRLAASGSK